MGTIEVRFGGREYANEAEVSQNFVLPILTDFLGYDLGEILPERQFPAVQIPQNRGKSALPQIRPDFIVTTGQDRYVFVVDSKGPGEDIDDHLDQMRAYCIALRLNLLVISNGIELKVFDANALVFYARSVADLDVQYVELHKLLARERTVRLDVLQRIQEVNRSVALGESTALLNDDEQRKRVAVSISDYIPYLTNIGQMSSHIQLPPNIQAAFDTELNRFSPHELYRMVEMVPDLVGPREAKQITYSGLLQRDQAFSTRLIVGESGLGKSSLLQHMAADLAKQCLAYSSDSIPVLLKLGGYTAKSSLFDLIVVELMSRGARATADDVRSLLVEGRLILLLDAFDEAFDAHIPDLEREIDNLRATYVNTSIVISTRHFRIPHVHFSAKYELQTLTPDIIDRIAGLNLADESRVFLAELKAKRLYAVASNTLILSLLILLYLRDHVLPEGRSSTLYAVAEHVRRYYESKKKRVYPELTWQVIETFLSRLAYMTVSFGEGYALPQTTVREVLNQTADELEQTRLLERGATIDIILASLESTGFVVGTDVGIAFWHRSFSEHFAAVQLARNFDENREIPRDYIRSTAWDPILPLVASHVVDPSNYVAYMLSENVFLAGRCLIEFSEVDEVVARSVVEALFAKCASFTVAIRMYASNLLSRISGPTADARLVELTQSPYVNVKTRAIEEIARRGLPKAREIAYSNVDWDHHSEEERLGSSLISVIRALGELGDTEAQQAIIGIWRNKQHMWVDFAARTVLLDLARRGLIVESVRDLLCEMILEEGTKEHYWWNFHSLADVMKTIITPEIASRVAADLAGSEKVEGAKRFFDDILGSCSDPAFLTSLIMYIRDKSISLDAKAAFLRALAHNAESVPEDVFCEQLMSRSYELRVTALLALARTRPELVREYALRAFRFRRLRDRVRGYPYAPVQVAALQVVAANKDVEVLLAPLYRGTRISDAIIEKLCDIVAEGGPTTILPYLDRVLAGTFSTNAKLRVAWLYSDLGKTERSSEIVRDLWSTSDMRTRTQIIEGAHRLPADMAVGLVKECLEASQERDDGGLLRHTCFECLAAIGTTQAANILADTASDNAQATAHRLDQEAALRALIAIAPRDRQTWLLALLAERKIEPGALHRAIEMLGVIGTKDSLPALFSFLRGTDTFLQFISFWAIDQIYRRDGELWYGGEEKLVD